MNVTTKLDYHLICDELATLAINAGNAIMAVYQTDFQVIEKADASPVTKADKLGEEIIVAGLANLAPTVPVLAEEAASEGNIPVLGNQFFLVDPLDGTREFVNRTDEFTVNIALIEKGRPVIGVVYAPAMETLYAGIVGDKAWRQKTTSGSPTGVRENITALPTPQTGLIAVASRSHRSAETDSFLETLDIAEFEAAGSSLKFCLIAEGRAHVYPRFGRTMEWDTGAGHAVLLAAGGKVIVHPGDEPLTYNKKDRGYDNPYFIAWGS